MPGCARKKLLLRDRAQVVHCYTRCVRRAFLAGVDPLMRDYLVETCTIMEQRFPDEYEEWQAAGKQEREEHRKQLEAVKDDPTATLAWTLGRAKDYFSSVIVMQTLVAPWR